MTITKHNEIIVEQFTKQAVLFAKIPGHLESVQMLLDMSEVDDTDSVLDVACGPGLVACAFANVAKNVTGIDITKKMIEQATVRQKQMKINNIAWDIGSVSPLPYDDDTFSIVVTRYSFHHFVDPEYVLSEMKRVCRPGGRIMVVDVALPLEKVELFNRMERLRDPSHTKALTLNEFHTLFEKSNLRKCREGAYSVEVELNQQLEASFPNSGDDVRVKSLVEQDVGRNDLGINAYKKGGKVYYTYPISIYVALKE